MEGEGCSGSSSDAFIDRSRVRILLCDNNPISSQHAFTLLSQHCSYQVTCVKSARQVIDALNAEGRDIDIILSEVDLPMAKGMKMLKYIMRDKDLRRIPVIMMSAQDEVSIVVKCLRLGAADYLVKPLRTNELLNLWTHMWRRRRMLGLAEKNIMNYEFDLVASDPSDGNTNSTTLFSDDTDDKSRKSTNPEIGIAAPQEDETNASVSTSMVLYATPEQPHLHLLDCRPDVPGISDRRTGQHFFMEESSHAYYKSPPPPRGRQLPSFPKKSELRIGASSAFFTYVPKSTASGIVHDWEIAKHDSSTQDKLYTWAGQVRKDNQDCENTEPRNDFPTNLDCHPKDNRLSAPTVIVEFPNKKDSKTDACSPSQLNPRNESQSELSNSHWQNAYPYYIPGLIHQGMTPQYPDNLPQCPPHIPNMPSFPYYPMGLCLQPGQIPTPHHQWPSYGTLSSATDKLNKVDRREAALMKFRQKRKERCFDKKIRYVNRKRLAERRPRVRGQFVRKMNGIDVNLNGTPCSVDLDEEEDEEENAGMDYSPEDDA